MDRRHTWREIDAMTNSMLNHARSGEWDSVIKIEADRQNTMQVFFADNPQQQDAEWIAAGIKSIMIMDKEIMQLGKSGVQELGRQLHNIHKGKKAQQAYLKPA